MKDPKQSTEHTTRHGARWLWLGAFTAFAVAALSSGRVLLGSGMLLLGVFAFYNDPLGATTRPQARPTPVLAASWACGLFAVMAIVAAGVRAWL